MLFLDLENHGFLADTCIKTCHITIFIKVPWFSRAVHTTIFSFKTLFCAVLRGSDHGKSIIYLILSIFLLVFTAAKIRVAKFIAFKHLLRCDSYIACTY